MVIPVILLITGIIPLPGCETRIQESPTTVTTPPPTSYSGDGSSLNILYPLPYNELIGGQELRVTLAVYNPDGTPIKGIKSQVELWSPANELFVELECIDQGKGRCLADPIVLPIRNAAGTWSILASAELEDGTSLKSSGPFQVIRSFSEGLEEHYGFWLDTNSSLFAYAGPPFADPKLKFHPYAEGGYVILSNSRISGGVEEFVMLDVHWNLAEFPEDSEGAIFHIQELAGPHGMTVDYLDLKAEEKKFQGTPAWRIKGYWEEPIIARVNRLGETTYPVEWLLFTCPDSEYTWTILITARNPNDMPGLREIAGTFVCPENGK
jgi:hypothetical protein